MNPAIVENRIISEPTFAQNRHLYSTEVLIHLLTVMLLENGQ